MSYIKSRGDATLLDIVRFIKETGISKQALQEDDVLRIINASDGGGGGRGWAHRRGGAGLRAALAPAATAPGPASLCSPALPLSCHPLCTSRHAPNHTLHPLTHPH